MAKAGGWRRVLFVGLAGAALGSAGCLAVAAGVAGAGAAGYAGYAYVTGEACQEFPARPADTWAAVHTALGQLQLPIVHEKEDDTAIESRTGDGTRIKIHLETIARPIPADGIATRVCVRVGVFGDEPLSQRILAEVGRHLTPAAPLVPVPAQPTPPPPPASLGPIQPTGAVAPAQTAPPPLLPAEPVPVRPR
jgi:hypothetical protein